MLSKQCVTCGSYFEGEWNGDYVCSGCRAAGAFRLRPLASRDAAVALPAVAAEAPMRREPAPPDHPATRAQGRAAA